MTVSGAEKDRRVLPRWRSSKLTASLRELASLGTAVREDDSRGFVELTRRVSEWRSSGKALAFAADVVSTALVIGERGAAIPAAMQVVAATEPGTLAHGLAQQLLSERNNPPVEDAAPGEEEPWRDTAMEGVRSSRSRVHRDPRNPLAWNDLARGYTVLGESEKAAGALRAGLSLAPRSRLLVRSACRLFAQLGDLEHAHDIVRRSDLAKTDPWIMAAEIAASSGAGRPPESVGRGKRMLADDTLAPLHVSELASAVATLEFESGNARRSRKLLRQSLRQPTDNSVAQAEWLSERAGLRDEAVPVDVPFSFEARALRFADERKWESALVEAHKWFHDEPFSVHSAAFGSWVASVGLEDFAEAERIAKAGLTVNTNDLILRNNLVFALASQDRVAEAERELALVDLAHADEDDRVFLLATEGLLNYRKGEIVAGRELYRLALSRARGQNAARMRAMASLNMAREELRHQSTEAIGLLVDALKTAGAVDSPDVQEVAARLKTSYGPAD